MELVERVWNGPEAAVLDVRAPFAYPGEWFPEVMGFVPCDACDELATGVRSLLSTAPAAPQGRSVAWGSSGWWIRETRGTETPPPGATSWRGRLRLAGANRPRPGRGLAGSAQSCRRRQAHRRGHHGAGEDLLRRATRRVALKPRSMGGHWAGGARGAPVAGTRVRPRRKSAPRPRGRRAAPTPAPQQCGRVGNPPHDPVVGELRQHLLHSDPLPPHRRIDITGETRSPGRCGPSHRGSSPAPRHDPTPPAPRPGAGGERDRQAPLPACPTAESSPTRAGHLALVSRSNILRQRPAQAGSGRGD